jgi:AraC-like DNA-binding protein
MVEFFGGVGVKFAVFGLFCATFDKKRKTSDKLCVTAKHLSKVVRQTSGKSANDLIDEYVALEAKALLKSTNMTVEQIADELNFPSQSFFGKYFKRVTGSSPSEYRRRE